MDKTYDVTGQFRIDQEDLERRFFFLMLNGSYSDPKLGALTAANYGDSMTAQAPFVLLLVELLKRIERRDQGFEADLIDVNALLIQCQTHPMVTLGAALESLSLHQIPTAHTADYAPTAMLYAVRLLRANQFKLLRLCGCGTWYMASRPDQKACTPKCYLRQYQATPEAKEKRLAYDRAKRDGKFKPKPVKKGVRRINGKA